MTEERFYYPYSKYLKHKYGEKVYKLPVNLPAGCPNRLTGPGCFFCAGPGAGFEAMDASVPVREQLEETRRHIAGKYHAHKYIAYFQNYTNTFLPVEQFEAFLLEAAGVDGVVEIAVSTRPDCISAPYLEVLDRIRRRYGLQVTVELGLQTANYRTLRSIGRGHTLAEFLDAVLQIRACGFEICTHVILNLPGDDQTDVEETAKILSALSVSTVKLHSLYVAKNTRLCEEYENGTITLCSREEYLDRVILFLEYLSPDIAVERLFSRIPEKESVFCNWGVSWWKLRDELFDLMGQKETRQGKKFDYLNGAALRHLPD